MGRQITALLKDVGTKVAMMRLARNFSQEELAARIGISRNALGSIERGESEMKISTLISVCKILNVTPNEMLPAHLSKAATDFPELNAIAEKLREMSPYQRSLFFTIANLVLAGIMAKAK